jgi:SacI-like restriction endonuclease
MPKKAARLPSPVHYVTARTLLEREFSRVEEQVLNGQAPALPQELNKHFDAIFESSTQAYREVFLGCILARLNNPSIDIHKPYMSQGSNAYNGRTLDERVVNPFLHERRIPCSGGPFLSLFRRSVQFVRATSVGVKDREAFESFISLVDHVAGETDNEELLKILRYLFYRFIRLREASHITLSRLHRISLEQFDGLVGGLLATPSGGRLPVILVEAAFITITDTYDLNWRIEVQGINVADSAGGAGGDITIRKGDQIILTAEVTERSVNRSRVMATFQTKIAIGGIVDYLFLLTSPVGEEAIQQARQYFSQGHEINFVEIKNWIKAVLATVGIKGRGIFNRVLVERLDAADIPPALKVAWNEQVARITAS